nr:DUF2514 family protein [uncultured Roseateles sp.]
MLPKVYALAIGAALACAAGFAAGWAVNGWRLDADLERERKQIEQMRSTLATERADMEAAERLREQSWRDRQQEADDANRQEVERARADAAAAGDVADRLRERARALAAACSAPRSDPAASASSTPAESPGELLADMQRRLTAAAAEYARVADERGAAGNNCERRYDALTTGEVQP